MHCLFLKVLVLLTEFALFTFLFFSWGSSGSKVGVAVSRVTATNLDLSLSHVMKRASASVLRVWLESSVTAVAGASTVSMAAAAQVLDSVNRSD